MAKMSKSYDSFVIEHLAADDELAINYLNDAIEDGNIPILMTVLRRLADARGVRLADLARKLDVDYSGLHRVLSGQTANPSCKTVLSLLKALGLELKISA